MKPAAQTQSIVAGPLAHCDRTTCGGLTAVVWQLRFTAVCLLIFVGLLNHNRQAHQHPTTVLHAPWLDAGPQVQ